MKPATRPTVSPPPAADSPQSRCGERWMAATLVMCAMVVAFWQIMAHRSHRGVSPFEMTAEDFVGFAPRSPHWTVSPLPVRSSSIEPNVLAYSLRQVPGSEADASGLNVAVRLRLVHGYNMVDCMRIKGYQVTLLGDTRRAPEGASEGPPVSASLPGAGNRQVQAWRLTSGAGDVSLAVTAMLGAGEFRETPRDVRSMAFPRVGIPDDPNWLPDGLRLSSLRHPLRNLHWLIRSQWNNARCDVATFLRLKQPAWVSDELFTLVAESDGGSIRPADEAAVLDQVLAAHGFLQQELEKWRRAQLGEP